MANALTLSKLDQYGALLQAGDVDGFYKALIDEGYKYAGWAEGVARGDTLTGASAREYLNGSALMGLGIDACKDLSFQKTEKIVYDMADGYFKTLRNIAENSEGVLNRDVSFKETYSFHEKAFKDNNLGIDNWTLKTPFDIIKETQGEQAAEERWEKLRDTGGTGWDGLWESVRLSKEMGQHAFSPDSSISDRAREWMDKAPGTANWEQISRAIGALGKAFKNTRIPGVDMIDPITGLPWSDIDRLVDQFFDTARAWRQPVDPLMLDLDGDGLELKRADGSILFDHNTDTIRTGTGWIGSDDGILVRDLNANGTIDSGRELFGIDTLKRDGKNAVNGFDALGDLDSNADGQLDAADLAWGSLQVWRDLDQDGVTDVGELVGLDALGINRIGLNGSATNMTGGTQAGTTVNGNFIAQSASFTREVEGVQVTRTVGAVDLESNAFYREFTVAVPLTEQARSLPGMQGSGRARDLAEAVSLSPALGVSLAAFSSATTRDTQRALLDGLLTDWAQSSDYWQSLETTLDGNVKISGLPTSMTEAQYRNLVGVLEVFNGERFYSTGANGTTMTAGTTKTGTIDTATNITRAGYGIAPPAAQLALLQQSYDALKESVYSALVLQTRLKPYLDAIELTIDENGIRFDTTALASLLDQPVWRERQRHAQRRSRQRHLARWRGRRHPARRRRQRHPGGWPLRHLERVLRRLGQRHLPIRPRRRAGPDRRQGHDRGQHRCRVLGPGRLGRPALVPSSRP
ncbi:hypothetical protein GCM10023165_39660 [Variovorax defluvii]|uniref:Uncharacterized protein n=1 Tax=Variovorax defluvii TaxID=913761 RepID=A0ABP8I565_9BURK